MVFLIGIQVRRMSCLDSTAYKPARRAGSWADYLITGTVPPMTNAAAVFCRLIDTATGSLDSAAQVLVPLTDDIRSLLAR